MNAYLGLLAGLACAAIGGELFVRGTVGIARAARIAPGIIATTVAAFATSSPELTIAISSAFQGVPQISLGDALGSNLVNVALVLGLTMLIVPLSGSRDINRDFSVAILAPIVLGVMLLDGRLSRVEGAVLAAGFLAWLALTLNVALKQRAAGLERCPEKWTPVFREKARQNEHLERRPDAIGTEMAIELVGAKPLRAFVEGLIGLGLLIVAGKLIVFGATGIAQEFGLSSFVIGATVVAIGTSVPELATTLISAFRGHHDVGLGTILGSNIFNGTLILAVASIITPIEVEFWTLVPVLVLGMLSLAIVYPFGAQTLGRWRGLTLLALYAVYIGATLKHG